jgi:nicotinamidase-related amidase
MPVTTLDPKTALVIIDLQKGISAYPMLRPFDEIVVRANALIAAFRAKGLPIVPVVVDGGLPGRTEKSRGHSALPPGFADLAPGLETQPSDIHISKKSPGAFAHTDLEQKLVDLGVTQVVLAGISTSNGVESTARQAYELGFNVTLATDAMTDGSQELHDYSITRIFPKIGETGTSDDIIALLDAQSA